MTTIEGLEAQLREGLDRGVDPDIIVVYADLLQEQGDLRGELITIDLEIEHGGGSTPALQRRRSELIESWLGPQRPSGAIRYGFIELDATSANPVEQVRLAFDGKAARFVRSVIAVGPPKLLREALGAISDAPRPFLSRVVLRQWSEKTAATVVAPEDFLRAVPHLRSLEVDARNLFESLPHPSIRRLRLSGFDALGTLDLPALVELDLALQCHLAATKTAPTAALFTELGAHSPNLTVLDLSRNEPGHLDPHTLGGDTPLFDLLSRIGCREQLVKLSVPPPPDANAIASIHNALMRMPNLRELVIPRVKDPSILKSFERPGLVVR